MEKTFGHRIICDRLLGKGAFGSVSLCHDEFNNVFVTKEIDMTKYGVGHPLELSIMTTFHHRALNTALSISIINNKLYIRQQYANCDISKYTRYRGGLRGECLRYVCSHIVQGLACMHNEKIIHADIKPANILVFIYHKNDKGELVRCFDHGMYCTKTVYHEHTKHDVQSYHSSRSFERCAHHGIECGRKSYHTDSDSITGYVVCEHHDRRCSKDKHETFFDARLADFSLAIPFPENNRTYNHSISTRSFRSIEAWTKNGWNEKLDIWSLGASLFEIAYNTTLIPNQMMEGENKEEMRRDDALADRYINAILEASEKLNPGTTACYRDRTIDKSIDWHHVHLPKEFYEPEYREFNNFIIPMLSVSPQQRPSVDALLSSPYLSKCERLEYKILFPKPRKLSDRMTKQSIEKLRKYTDDPSVIELTLRILQRACGCSIRGDDRLYGCLWIASKICKRPLPKDLVIDHSVEREIGEHTQWQFIGTYAPRDRSTRSKVEDTSAQDGSTTS